MNHQKDKNQKIAIIGAGIAGLTAAHTLKKKGYNNITIFEAQDRVGGKVHTVKKDDLLYEIGGIMIFDNFKKLKNLAKEYHISLKRNPGYSLIYSGGKYYSPTQYMRKKYGIIKMMKSNLRFIKILTRFKKNDRPGFMDVDPDFYINFKDFSKKYQIDPIADILESAAPNLGYGDIDDVPAFYYIKSLKDTQKFSLYSELNRMFGLRLSAIYMFEHGFQNFLEKIAEKFNVKLRSRVTQIKRNKDGDSFKISITANDKTELYDRVIISSVPVQIMKSLDIDKDEHEIFSRVKYYHFHATLFYGDNLPESGNGITFDNSSLNDIKGALAGIAHLNPEHDIYIAYQLDNGEYTEEQLRKKISEGLDRIGGKVREYILTATYEYFPHFTEKVINNLQPFKRLEKMQGNNGTYYIGSLMNFEATESNAEYSEYLINKHF